MVDNFNEGRQLMRDSVNQDEAASYNTPANEALIRFTESDSDNSVPAADRTWIYPMLDWTSTPNLGKVFLATQYVARQPAEGDDNPAGLASASWSGRYHADSLGTNGFNQRVQVFTSKDEPPTLDGNGERTANPAHCGNQQNGEEANSYNSIAIARRQ